MTPRFAGHALLTAVQFLTRVPVGGGMSKPGADPRLLAASVVWFPLVGGLIGRSTGCVAWAALQVWPPLVAVLLALLAEALLTGAFHEDAVADCCDAFGGGYTRDDVLRIMKDSRVGSFGALGLGLFVALRVAGLSHVPGELLVATATAAGALGRFAVLPLMAGLPPIAHREGLSKDVGARITGRVVAAGTVLTVPALVALGLSHPVNLVAGCLASVVVVALWASYVMRRLGGVTGDCLGAACYFTQVTLTLAAGA